MIRRRPSALLVAILLGATAGCSVHHGDFTVLSDVLVDLSRADLSSPDRARGVVGEDVTDIVLFVPRSTPSLEGAIRDALRKGGGDLMTDVTVTSHGWYLPLIWGRVGWRVEGDVVKTRRNR